MAKPEELPESIILGQFAGIRNTVAPERLLASELEAAVNVDIDDAGQLRRRRGFRRVEAGDYHSLHETGGKVYGVRGGALGIIRPDYSFYSLANVGQARLSYATVGDKTYFSSALTSGIIVPGDTVEPWGAISAGTWLSPVVNPTATLGEVSGKLLGPPPLATEIEYYKGRIYMGQGKTLWATELYLYNHVDKTRNFMPLEHTISLVMAVEDGLYVGTTGGLYFLEGVLGEMKLSMVTASPVLAGSGVRMPADLVHPAARQGAEVPVGEAVVLMTGDGIFACFDNGTCFSLTQDRVVLPEASSAAALFRQDSGVNSYVAAADSAGSPGANARIGDYVSAEIRRF